MMASPRFFTEHQPDGSPVTLRLRGDEQSHWMTDEEDYIVFQVDDGTYVYATEEEEVLDTRKNSGQKTRKKFIPSKDDIVGRVDPIAVHEGFRAEKEGTRTAKKYGNANSVRKFARYHPQVPNNREFDVDCIGRYCGDISEPSGDGKTRRHLRKGIPTADTESPVQKDGPEFHNRRSALPTTGTIKNLVVLLQFKDHEQQRRILPSYDDVESLMDTLADVYRENSFGKLTIESTVIPEWYTTSHEEAWYAAADGASGTANLHEAMREALDDLEDSDVIDLIDHDGNGDGYVDSVTFLHSGYGAEYGGVDCDGRDYRQRIWSHQWQLHGDEDDGDDGGDDIGPWTSNSTDPSGETIKVWKYQAASALKGVCGDTVTPVGAIAHEFGHILGLPDLASGNGNGLGAFCLMADAWGFDETLEHPSQMSAWSKLRLGWLEARTPKFGANEIALAEHREFRSDAAPKLYKIGDGEFNFPKDEYLLIEYRGKTGLDAGLPGEGLLIYHVDEAPDVPDNSIEGHPWQNDGWPRNGKHYRVALVQADRLYSLERGINDGGKNDFFSAGYVNALLPSDDSDKPWEGPFPNTDSYQNGIVAQTGVKIYNISPSGKSAMTFTFRGNLLKDDKVFGSSPTNDDDDESEEFRSSAEIDGYGNAGSDSSRENRWRWKIDPSFEIGSLRFPVGLGNAPRPHQP
eukprot:CAMPEP_0197180818 /NCGR_PEP_ID=MMETSP1423-20130617/5293_1 /TAXON_ID=476441 /ORGANISM="Pseudo-nitzschia heimii, Strain UNC1101" /LENGTH=686 /DNA_ID=CAMNT_0042630947 /DNA_START=138 /DNA_END=2198 /DNA_ORIENTATION=-